MEEIVEITPEELLAQYGEEAEMPETQDEEVNANIEEEKEA